jgi:hypothetical protein
MSSRASFYILPGWLGYICLQGWSNGLARHIIMNFTKELDRTRSEQIEFFCKVYVSLEVMCFLTDNHRPRG